jgi:phosphoglycolate phosphatase-like HAD superfamily hydrolase/ADP-ribose pyrophosphatase YjhB (NUDIX family)
VIFDWSGTLVDDLPAVWQATNQVLQQAGRAEISLEQFRAEFCVPYRSFYERHTPGIPGAQVETWFHAAFRRFQDSVTPLPHARGFLEFCRTRGLRMTVLSAMTLEHFAKQADEAGFSGYFEKPHLGAGDKRKVVQALLVTNGFAPRETLFIGDMAHDIETAKVGGVQSCAVLTGYTKLAQLRASEPDLIVEHLGELREILERNQMRLKPDTDAGSEVPACKGSTGADARPVVTVGALIFNAAGEVLMVRTHKWSDLWGIPGGKVKWGEASEAALRREIKEETDLDVTDIKFVLVQDCIHSKEFYRDAHFVLLNYTARCVGEPSVKLNDEAREFAWVTVPKALGMQINQPTRVLLEAVR